MEKCWTPEVMANEEHVFLQQGFGAAFNPVPPYGLLVVDFVNGFADPEIFGGGNTEVAIDRTGRLLTVARARGWPVAHSRIVFQDDHADSNIFSLKVPALLRLTEDEAISQIVNSLKPRPGELVISKTVPSAFFGTTLSTWLNVRGVKTLLIAGASTSGCVRASVVDAMSWGYRPIVVEDCVGDRSQSAHEASLFDMRQKYALVMSCEEALELTD